MSEQSIRVEEVDAVAAPPKARVEDVRDETAADTFASGRGEAAADTFAGGRGETAADTFERKRDYLTGFLSRKPAEADAGEPGGALHDAVVDALKEIYDPEIPVNIYDLGLIYGVEVTGDGHAAVTMTLTTPHCPVAESMPGEVELRVGAVPGISIVDVNLVWDPPWDPAKMSDEARLELGML